jgi:hypothetical protein
MIMVSLAELYYMKFQVIFQCNIHLNETEFTAFWLGHCDSCLNFEIGTLFAIEIVYLQSILLKLGTIR